ncbi:hypothetical protein CULC809_00020 [Corynebacterium ulcerans 809]|nr:hypothetical protein CULC809_00020 [Corynebacterium ulcerans 809]
MTSHPWMGLVTYWGIDRSGKMLRKNLISAITLSFVSKSFLGGVGHTLITFHLKVF